MKKKKVKRVPATHVEPERERVVIATPARLRGVLLEALVGVLEGRVNVAQANAVAGLSGEVHKSIRQEWEMYQYSENVSLARARLHLLGTEMDIEGEAEREGNEAH